ncbi:hypothetical protein BDN67DRAFT_969758 [Paxillus ammoniavirescens]|nr:hypothetical protein BDN67DRAFT_969758 [Paxillus ammoniavirescens]
MQLVSCKFCAQLPSGAIALPLRFQFLPTITVKFMEPNKVLKNQIITLTAGVSLSLLIFAVLTGQVALYFWRRSIHGCDPLWIKGVVVCIWVLQVLEIALACRMTTSSHGEHFATGAGPLGVISCQCAIYIGACATTAILVHALFVRRIYILSKHLASIKLPIVISFVIVLEGSFGIFSMVSLIKMGLRHPLGGIPVGGFFWLGFSITADIMIAGSLRYILNKNRTGFASTEWLIKRLVRFCVQTGLIMSLIAGLTLALWAAAKLDTDHLVMSFPMGGIYAVCLMANLIARESYLRPRVMNEDTELVTISRRSMVFVKTEDIEKNPRESLEQAPQTRTSATFSNDGSATAVEL